MMSSQCSVPNRIEDVDADWMTAAFAESGVVGPDVCITSVIHERIAIGTGFASNIYRLRLAGAGEFPRTVIVKLPSDAEAYRSLGAATGMYTREVDYYAAIAHLAPLSAPTVYAARRGDSPGSFVLVLEDLAHLEAADHLVGLSIPRAESVIESVAALHAWSAHDGAQALKVLDLPASDDPLLVMFPELAFSAGWATYATHARTPIPASFAGVEEYMPALAPLALAELDSPRVLVHGDLRADNLFFDSVGRPTIVDYQLVRWGSGVTDVAYLLSQGLRTADRRGHDRRLIEHYRSELAAHGMKSLGPEELWRQYQIATMLQLMYPLVALTGWNELPERGRELCLTLVERALATAQDISAPDVLETLR